MKNTTIFTSLRAMCDYFILQSATIGSNLLYVAPTDSDCLIQEFLDEPFEKATNGIRCCLLSTIRGWRLVLVNDAHVFHLMHLTDIVNSCSEFSVSSLTIVPIPSHLYKPNE